MDEDWPTQPVVGYTTADEKESLHQCPHKESIYIKGSRVNTCITLCGIETTEKAKAIFGRNAKGFIAEVESKTVVSKWPSNRGVNGGQVVVVDNRAAMANHRDGYKQHSWEKDMYREDGSWKHWSDF